MSVASAALLATWIGSIALLSPGIPLAGPEVARTALVALVWMAFAGVPWRIPLEERTHRRIPVIGALALGPLAVALALDHAAGHGLAETALTAGVAALLFVALHTSARRDSAGYPVLWFSLVLGAPILAAMVGWGHSAPPHAALATLRDASPLGWCYDRIRGAGAHPAWPLGASAVLLAAAFLGRGRRAS